MKENPKEYNSGLRQSSVFVCFNTLLLHVYTPLIEDALAKSDNPTLNTRLVWKVQVFVTGYSRGEEFATFMAEVAGGSESVREMLQRQLRNQMINR